MDGGRVRLDQALVAQGLAGSRARARAMIESGLVAVGGAVVRKAATRVSDEDLRVLPGANPWVSRAALKLVHGLEVFGLSPAGARAVDVGASTGGFSQVLRARGAAHVIALDVGHGQIAAEVAADPVVEVWEGVNARHLDPAALGVVDWVVCDVSFISATLALPPVLAAARAGAVLVSLVKPQFELSPAEIGKGGVVKDPAARAAALARVRGFLGAEGWDVTGEAESPVAGSDGNVEVLVAAVKR